MGSQVTYKLGPQNPNSELVTLANLSNFSSSQICGFAICGTYLRNAHLSSLVRARLKGTYPGWRTRMNLVHVRG
jgi:hypothetical protein